MRRARVPTKIFLNIVPTVLVTRPPGASFIELKNTDEFYRTGKFTGVIFMELIYWGEFHRADNCDLVCHAI